MVLDFIVENANAKQLKRRTKEKDNPDNSWKYLFNNLIIFMAEKWCSYHKRLEPIENFYRHTRYPDGLTKECKEAMKIRMKDLGNRRKKEIHQVEDIFVGSFKN